MSQYATLGINDTQAQVLGCLHRARGALVSGNDVRRAVWGEQWDEYAASLLRVHVYAIRRRLGEGFVRSNYGGGGRGGKNAAPCGYFLPAHALAHLDGLTVGDSEQDTAA